MVPRINSSQVFTLILVVVSMSGCLATTPVAAFAAELKTLRDKAEAGDSDAQCWLGIRYRDGDGVERNHGQSVAWLRKSADQNNVFGLDALGWMHYRGLGVPQSYAIAAGYFQEAAGRGNGQAQKNLGQLYFDGLGVPQSHTDALKWWRKGAGQGNVHAQYLLASMHYCGDGVPTDVDEAFAWCRKAAEQKHDDARVLLGELYFTGTGIKADQNEARRCWRTAVDGGNRQAKELLTFAELRNRQTEPEQHAYVEVRQVRQGWNNCACASAAMVVRRLGHPQSQYDIKRRCPNSPIGTGTDWGDLLVALSGLPQVVGSQFELKTFTDDPAGFEEGLAAVRAALDTGMPVMIDIAKDPEASAHTVVATGYDAAGKLVIIRDPAIGPPGLRLFTFDELQSQWHSRWYSRKAKQTARASIFVVRDADRDVLSGRD